MTLFLQVRVCGIYIYEHHIGIDHIMSE